jgi:uncharacterized protein (TIGR03437 family)
LGRLAAGPPRISALFNDLNPEQAPEGVRVLAEANRVVVSWSSVPEYSDFGTGRRQTFQIRLYPTGNIEFAYGDVNVADAIVGLTPGGRTGSISLVDLSNPVLVGPGFSGTVAERFSSRQAIDLFAAAQKFYANHEDSYDYLVFYNTLGISPDTSTVASQLTVRQRVDGIGRDLRDLGDLAGSRRRLQSLMNMGALSQYPADPNGIVPERQSVGDTPLTTLGHEAGHLFTAYVSTLDPEDPDARPLLGFQGAHWAFTFNSNASLVEGNEIEDRGEGVTPRFLTVAAADRYSPLDQYLMGLRAPEDVPPSFWVDYARGASGLLGPPRVGVTFDGIRRDVSLGDIVAVEGRRVPDHTVAQRRFRFAFVLIVDENTEPTAEQISQVERYRGEFERFFATAADRRAVADASLRRALHISAWPATGVIAGRTGTVSVQLEQPAPIALQIALTNATGAAVPPPSVTVPAGATRIEFSLEGRQRGVDLITATPSDARYETVQFHVAVSAISDVRLLTMTGDFQVAGGRVPLPNPVRLATVDRNNVPYPDIPVTIEVTGGGQITPSSPATDAFGIAAVSWVPGPGPVNELRVQTQSGASTVVTALGTPAFTASSVLNAASYAPGLTPGGIAVVFGANLAGAEPPAVILNGRPASVLYSNPRQINLLVPETIGNGPVTLEIRAPGGSSGPVQVPLLPVHPGIFYDAASGYGAVVLAGTLTPTQQQPVRPGDVVEIYGTGWGPTERQANGLRTMVRRPLVTIGGRPADVVFAGLSPGSEGLYQVNASVPSDLPAGTHDVVISVGETASNTVRIVTR